MEYLLEFLAGILGILLHSGMKMKEINEKTPSTVAFTDVIAQYLRQDWPMLFLSVIGLFVGVIMHNEFIQVPDNILMKYIPENKLFVLQAFTLSTFTAVMFMFDSLLMAIQNSTQRLINFFSKTNSK